MNAGMRFMGSAVGLIVLLGAIGCQDGRDEQIRALQRQMRELGDENGNLKNLLAACNTDAENAKQNALRVQQMLDDCRRQLANAPSVAAPITQQPDGWERQGAYAWTSIEEQILFDSGKADLKGTGKQALQKVVAKLRSEFPGKIYMVIGHTDSDPIQKSNWKDNLDLSLERGRVVANELIAMGIDPKALIAGGQGQHNPKAPNDNKNNKQTNRRVTIVAVDPPPGRSSIAGLDQPVLDSSGTLVAMTMD